MKKSFLLGLACFGFTTLAQAVDVECVCPDTACSDVSFTLDQTGQGEFLSITYAYGDTVTEGYPTVTRHATTGKTIYLLNGFIIVEQDGQYTMPGRNLSCSAGDDL